jgi:HSP90 family molecular chaperone
MKSGQKDIFYLTGSSKEQLEKSPFLEQLTKKNYEVCFCDAPFSSHIVQFYYSVLKWFSYCDLWVGYSITMR